MNRIIGPGRAFRVPRETRDIENKIDEALLDDDEFPHCCGKRGDMERSALTCVYCGMAYPEGTPPHGAQVLTDHIKVCEKHPLRDAETKIRRLRTALAALIGAETKEELEQMEAMIRIVPAPDHDRMVAVNAIRILLETS